MHPLCSESPARPVDRTGRRPSAGWGSWSAGRRLLTVIWLLGTVACAAPPTDGSGAARSRTSAAPAAAKPELYSIALDGAPAAAYETEASVGGPLASALARRFAGLQLSACLERAADAHTRLPQGFEQHLPLAFTEFALHWAGCPDPTATLSILLTDEPGPDALLDALEPLLAGERFTHAGVAVSAAPPPHSNRWFVLLVDRRVRIAPVPTSVEPGSSVALQFRLDVGFSRATIAVTTPRGATDLFEAGVSGTWVVAGLELSSEIGRQWIELIGYGADGPRVLALFPIEIGRNPPRVFVGTPTADESWVDTVDEAEALAARLVRSDRDRFGLPGLEWDPVLAEIARSHSREMADEDYFAHVSPRTGSVADRLTQAGYPASFAAENIAMAPSLGEAQERLMRSPGHRAAILSPEATHFGVGVSSRRQPNQGTVHHLTQIFVRRPRESPIR